MRTRLLFIALAIVACAALAVAATAGARGAAKTRVTIKGPNGDFHGRIFSPKAKCLGGRTVKVYKLKGNGYDPAHDKKIASDTSERDGDHGVWSVGNTGAKNGTYYALATRSPGCKRGFSKPLTL
jgi:hypothetical protein